MRVDQATVSSESFVGNLHAVLLRLCEPFMDAGYTKVRFLSWSSVRTSLTSLYPRFHRSHRPLARLGID